LIHFYKRHNGFSYLMLPILLKCTMNFPSSYVLLALASSQLSASSDEDESEGYLVYCPCMGRFGNQADQFLGTLAFAKSVGRTLVLPPWIEYSSGHPSSIMVSWDEYFSVAALKEYSKVISMEEFLSPGGLGEQVWPPHQRIVFCYSARHGSKEQDCNAKDGNPFGPFWDHFNISFSSSIMYAPLSFTEVDRWGERFPSSLYPVLAFTGPPAAFPVQQQNVHLHKYLQWNEKWEEKAKLWIKSNMPTGSYVGIHLRNGVDWSRACEHVESVKNLFSSPQCLGYRNEKGELSMDICSPSKAQVLKAVKKAVQKVGAKGVFVASDSNFMMEDFRKHFKKFGNLSFHRQDGDSPHLDLAILGLSNYFIGNCVSSFSAFVKRERDTEGLPSSFFGVSSVKSRSHDSGEL